MTLGGFFRTTTMLCGLVFGWFLTMTLVMLVTEVTPAALAIVPDVSVLSATSHDVKIIRGGNHILVLTSDRSGYVSELYRAGAWVVLPALRNGCLDMQVLKDIQ